MKIALMIVDDFSMWHFHKGLLLTLKERGFEVYAITPDGPYVEKIRSLGITHIAVEMDRFINPYRDFMMTVKLYHIFRKEKFDIVHTMTIKPNIYGSIAAKLAGVKKVVGIAEGLGFTFGEPRDLKVRLLKPIIKKMYKFGLRFTDKFWFVNPDDMALLCREKIIPVSKALLVTSAGINIDEYSIDNVKKDIVDNWRQELQVSGQDILITMVIARMVWSKGVREFLTAAELVLNRRGDNQLKFLLLGPLETHSPDAIPQDYLESKKRDRLKIITSFRTNIKELIAISDVVVLPSYYREGCPVILLEAAAMGKPLITTDNVGCREVVADGNNGILVETRNTAMLAQALERMIDDAALREQYGKASRRRAEIEFDERMIFGRIINELYLS
jgi:N,N'-diacetylbacillosaminyl-diphospho-undecaprenol alpha-1,3-N-acetylgalactosaminyltransferase